MDSEDLKSVQDALRQAYAQDPSAAQVTLRAHGHASRGFSCDVDTERGIVEAGPHRAMGGNAELACPADMLLESLVACAGVTLRNVAAAMEVTLREAVITAEGDLDFRGVLAVADDVPVGFRDLRLHFELDTDASDETREALIRLTERYCVVLQTLRPAISVSQKAPRPAST
jgi:uncharacterized OsmC-like protein